MTGLRAIQGWTLPAKRIAVVRALMLGDLLCAIPAVRALRKALPHAEITLIGLPWAAELVHRFPDYFNGFLLFPGFPGLPEQPFKAHDVLHFFRIAHEARFDLVIQMHGSGSYINTAVELMDGRRCAGFYEPGQHCPDPELFMPYPHDGPEVHRHLRLMKFLGAAAIGDQLEFPIWNEDRIALARLEETRALAAGSYVCVHPGARFASRRWPVERFARVANALAAQGLQVVITGSAAEVALTEQLSRLLRGPHINLAGRTNLGMLAALLAEARLLITNDTGISHLAAAVEAPSVVIVLGSDPRRWAPLDAMEHRTVMSEVECRPCDHWNCPIGFPCAEGVSPEMVLKTAHEVLNDTNSALNTKDEPTCASCES